MTRARSASVQPITHVPFNRPYVTGRETEYIAAAVENMHLSGDGPFTKRCRAWLLERTGARDCLLVHSCTAALELSALLLDCGPGDEVIMPSFTFVTTANAFVLRGARPVFVDIRPDTLNLDERLLERAITPRTKAIVPVHYAGVGCELDAIVELAAAHGLAVIEDAAQGLGSTYRGRPLGSVGDLGTLSFHETKNVSSGEGGALLINGEALRERAEVLRDKGTNRGRFFRGQVDKYTWVDLGSSYALSDLAAAFLWAQLERADEITALRRSVWDRYQDAFAELEAEGLVRRPIVPEQSEHNSHLYHLLVADLETRTRVIAGLDERGVNAVFHYVPLHSSPAGRRFGRAAGAMTVTDSASERLLRLPLWAGMDDATVERVIAAVDETVRAASRSARRSPRPLAPGSARGTGA